jgi:predicted nucleic acid-binding protein
VIVLDTNVISEPMRSRPDAAVVAWLNGQSDTALFSPFGILGTVLDGGRNLFWSEEEKRSICVQTKAKGVSVAHVARRDAHARTL